MASIEQDVAQIRSAVYGKDVRKAIADGIEKINDVAVSANTAVTNSINNFAGSFSTSTSYTTGQYVVYTNGKLYRFTRDHSAGSWNSNHVEAVNIGDTLLDLYDSIEGDTSEIQTIFDNFAGSFSTSISYDVGQYVLNTSGKLYRFTQKHSAGAWDGTHVKSVSVGKDFFENNVNYKGSLRNGDNLDNISNPGLYYIYTIAGGVPTNWPSDTIGLLISYSLSTTDLNGSVQFVVDYHGKTYIRYKKSVGWSSWRSTLYEDQTDSDIDLWNGFMSFKGTVDPQNAPNINSYTVSGQWLVTDAVLSSIENWPSQYSGRLVVFGHPTSSTNRIIQMAFDYKGDIYTRYVSSGATPWVKVLRIRQGTITSNNDLNNYNTYGQYVVSSIPDHCPSTLTGTLLVFGDENAASSRTIQIYVDYQCNAFIRYGSSGWSSWAVLASNAASSVEAITVKQSGGTFNNFPDAVKYVMDQFDAGKSIKYLIKVDPGTYDISNDVVRLINDGMEHQGLWIPPNTTICGAGKDKTIIRFIYDGNDDNVMSNVSAFNMPYESCLMDLTVVVKNIRYCIHSAIQPSGVSAKYIDDVGIKLVNVKLEHLGFDSGKNPTYSSPGSYGSGSTNGGKKEFYNCDFISNYTPWFNHNRKGLTKATEFVFEGCSFINKTTEISGSGKSSFSFITWIDDPQCSVYLRNCYINKFGMTSIRTDSYGDPNNKQGYYISSDGDLVLIDSRVNDSHLDDTFIDSYCKKLVASEAITAYTPVSKNALTTVRKYVASDSEHGIALNSVSSGEICCAKFGGHIPMVMLSDQTFAAGSNVGWNGSSWVVDNTNPIVRVEYSGIGKIL